MSICSIPIKRIMTKTHTLYSILLDVFFHIEARSCVMSLLLRMISVIIDIRHLKHRIKIFDYKIFNGSFVHLSHRHVHGHRVNTTSYST